MDSDKLLEPALLERVRGLHFRARQAAAGARQGARRSARIGHDLEFADFKPYLPGDALRDLDWKATARQDRPVVRRYRAETDLPTVVMFDASADLGSTPEKFAQARLVAATLAWLMHQEGEPVGLSIGAGAFPAGRALRWLPPRRGEGQLARLLALLASVEPGGRAELGRWLPEVGERLRARSAALVVTDAAEEPATWERHLDALARRRVDLRLFQIVDGRELGLEGAAPVQLFSPEGGLAAPVDPVAMRGLFAEEAGRFLAEVGEAVRRRRGLRYVVEARAEVAPILARFLRGAP